MRPVWAAACVASCAFSSAAFAADYTPVSMAERFYISFHGGSVFSSIADDTATKTSTVIVSQAVSKPGYIFGAALGKQVNNALRIEGEVNYSGADIDHVNVISPVSGTLSAAGSGTALVGMLNAYLTMPAGTFRPYVSAGIGIAQFTANNIAAPPGAPPNQGAVLNGTDTGWAYQLMAGVDVALSPATSLGGRYRYLKINDLSLPDGGYTHSFSTTSQSVEVVLTHHFN